ncbi:hypothetical protein PZN02_002751 [Sinorhizobium garamanticum]|uniref:Uncharacterized protein n=1 Tax=Sinorhizobium garamanticum TaxID=680247 RepID=A0ABY8D831_9HYPH|nr:hypothetical protein [Sinorhizobium garamanticum]WEX86467.1 hypothetical protein PZN02_002751 [Sinorhizobium garamanticum]
MKSLVPARFYGYDFSRLWVAIGFTLAIAVIIYGALFGRIF